MEQINAPSAQGQASRIANQYVLKGEGIQVSFSASSLTGEPLLDYRDRQRHVSAHGDEIQQVDVGIGTLVSIVLRPNADAGGLLFSVLIPPARLVGSDQRVAIHTVGITTHTAGFIFNTAQLDKYSVVKLSGEANSVEFQGQDRPEHLT